MVDSGEGFDVVLIVVDSGEGFDVVPIVVDSGEGFDVVPIGWTVERALMWSP